jgi:hypothetical protein
MINLIAMDVYNDTPTIVTIWLTIMPKLSILILLLELYLQIDGFEGNIIPYLPFIEYLNDYSELPKILSEYFNYYGGELKYEALRLTKPNSSLLPLNLIYEQAKDNMYYTKISDFIQIFENSIKINESLNIDKTPYINEFKELNDFISLQYRYGGRSVALYNLLFISSLLSLIIGTILGLAQTQLKRLLAYSTISHLGFILLALSINTEQALDSFLFYIIQYTITNLNVFLIIIAFNYLLSYLIKNNLVIKDIKYISELTSQYHKNPILAFSLIICLLSMAGMKRNAKYN